MTPDRDAVPTIAYNGLILRPPFSGVEKSVAALGSALFKRGAFNYRLVATSSQAAALTSMSAAAPLLLLEWSSSRCGRICSELVLLPRLLRRAGVALLHAPAYVAPPPLPCPVVLSLYDLHVYTQPQHCSLVNCLHYRWRLPASLRRAAAIIVPSRHTYHAVAHHFPEALPRTHIIPLGVDTAYFAPLESTGAEVVRQRYHLPPHFLLSVGTLTSRKNPVALFSAWEQLRALYPELKLVLTGRQRLAHLPPGVIAAGQVAESDMPALYSLAEMLLYPSHDEGFGLPVLEALAAGCPVVCSSGTMEEFAAAAALYLDPADPATIVAAVKRLRQEPQLRAELTTLGRELAQRYTWETTAAAVEELYKLVLAAPPR